MYKCFLNTILFFSVFNSMYGQTKSIQGRIYDSEDNQPIPFVSIGIIGDHRGTVSNANGEFSLIISEADFPVKLIFSHLSYYRDTVAVFDDALVEINLDKASVMLEEIVHQGSGFITSLLENAYEKLHREFNEATYSEAFYRQITQIDEKPTEIQEIIYHAKSNNSRVLGTKLKTGRYAANKDAIINFTNFSVYFKMFGLADENDSKNITVIHPRAREKYTFQLLRFIQSNDGEIAEVSFKCHLDNCPDPVNGLVHINTETYAIKQFMINILGSMNFEIKSPFVSYEPNNYNFKWLVNFSESTDKVIIDYIKVDFSFDLEKKKESHPVTMSSLTYFYNNTIIPTAIEYESTNPKVNDRDAIKNLDYDPDFWKNNPVVLRTPLEEEIIRAFEEKGSFGNMLSK